MLLLPLLAATVSTGTFAPEPEQKLVRAIYEELVNSNTSYSTGQTTPAARGHGPAPAGRRDSRRRTSRCSEPPPHKANLVARYRGTGTARPLLLLAHLDVVEAEARATGASTPSRSLEKDGYFYGRGTGDDKAQAAIWVASLLRMKREGYRPSRDLDPGADRGRGRRRPLQRRRLAAREPPRADRRRALPQRGRLGRDAGRTAGCSISSRSARSTRRPTGSRSATPAATARCRSRRTPSTASPPRCSAWRRSSSRCGSTTSRAAT